MILCNLSVVVIATMQLCGHNQILAKQDICGSVELSNGVQVQTLEETPGSNDTRRSSVGSYKKDGESEVFARNSGLFSRWRKLDVDAGDNIRAGNGGDA